MLFSGGWDFARVSGILRHTRFELIVGVVVIIVFNLIGKGW